VVFVILLSHAVLLGRQWRPRAVSQPSRRNAATTHRQRRVELGALTLAQVGDGFLDGRAR